MKNEPERLRIKEWAEEDRPREKLLAKGTQTLSNAELLAILIGSGNKEESAVVLSQRILTSVNNSLNELGKQGVSFLTKTFKGIGEAKAITIAACLELGRRRALENALEKTCIKSSEDAFHVFHPILADLSNEEIWVLFLNRANKIIGKKQLSIGGVSSSIVDIKLILKEAVNTLASSIILGHNHPSGTNSPSESDRIVTKKMKEACHWLDIKLLDHIIVAGESYFSFADENLII